MQKRQHAANGGLSLGNDKAVLKEVMSSNHLKYQEPLKQLNKLVRRIQKIPEGTADTALKGMILRAAAAAKGGRKRRTKPPTSLDGDRKESHQYRRRRGGATKQTQVNAGM